MTRKIAGVTDEAVEDATGADWDAWLDLLDGADATTLSHPEIVAALADAGVENAWWRQKIANGYERTRGMRKAGETADAGFQIGVQRTLAVPREQLWSLLVGPEGRAVWLGETDEFAPEPGVAYETSGGTTGEVRTVDPGARLRLTYRPTDWAEPSTLQFTLATADSDPEKTVLRVHHERLADGSRRDAMRERWRDALDRIEALVAEGSG